MKTENTPENKGKFFALYYFQKVLITKSEKFGPVYLTAQSLEFRILSDFGTDFLSLRSISSLMDEELRSVLDKQGYSVDYKYGDVHFDVNADNFAVCFESSKHDNYETVTQRTVDYIRSIGILIPWMDLSVEDIKAYGWAKEVQP